MSSTRLSLFLLMLGATAALADPIRLTYVPAAEGEPPVRVVGLRGWTVVRHPLQQADGAVIGKVPYGAGALHVVARGLSTETPTVRVGASADAARAADPLPASAIELHRDGFVRLRSTALVAGRSLRLFVVARGESAFAVLQDMGAWRATIDLGDDRQATVWSVDTDADGRPGDLVFVDVDGDDVLTRCEAVAADEAVRVADVAFRLTRDRAALRLARVEGDEAAKARDLRAELARAPVAGRPIPAFSFTDQDGRAVDSARLKGQVTILLFWCTL